MKKALKLFVTATLVVSILLSALYIVLYADHDCTPDNCCICEKIETAVCMIRTIMDTGIVLCAVVFIIILASGIFAAANMCLIRDVTPVALKVRLND